MYHNDSINEVFEIAKEVIEKSEYPKMSQFEALQIASKLYQIKVLKDAFLLGFEGGPGALEYIGMKLQNI